MQRMLMATAAGAAFMLTPMVGEATPILIIDEFNTDQRTVDVPGSLETNNSSLADAGVLGGVRDLQVQTTLAGATTPQTTLQSEFGLLGFSNNVTATGRGFITYDGDFDPLTVDTTGLGGVNFLIGPNPFFNFDVVTFESDLDVTIRAWDMDGELTTYFETLPPAGSFSPVLPLTLFDNALFDWSRVGALQFEIESNFVNYDGSIDSITVNAVPLPGAALLMFGGMGALSVLRLRRKV